MHQQVMARYHLVDASSSAVILGYDRAMMILRIGVTLRLSRFAALAGAQSSLAKPIRVTLPVPADAGGLVDAKVD